MTAILAGAGIAAFGVLSGLTWVFRGIGDADRRFFQVVNHARFPSWLDSVLRGVRPLGTSWALVVLAIAIGIWRPIDGASLLGVGLLSGGIERALKLTANRPRPFSTLPDVRLRLTAPKDPSFPSGDASRAWYMATATAAGLTPYAPLWAAAYLLAALVSVSRVRGGVHFPLDVWAGSCLGLGMGLIWAGFHVWLRLQLT